VSGHWNVGSTHGLGSVQPAPSDLYNKRRLVSASAAVPPPPTPPGSQIDWTSNIESPGSTTKRSGHQKAGHDTWTFWEVHQLIASVT
jgi:hypothetical protein